jgi:hypothetical protein
VPEPCIPVYPNLDPILHQKIKASNKLAFI